MFLERNMYYYCFYSFIIYKMRNPEIKETSIDEVKNDLSNLKEKIVLKEVIPQEEIKEYTEYFNELLEFQLPLAKKNWLTKKEEVAIRNVFNKLIEDIKKHPNAYIMSVKNIKKLKVPYMTGERDEFGFIEDFETHKSLGAKFNISQYEENILSKYHIAFSD